jgi:hypothetical protein
MPVRSGIQGISRSSLWAAWKSIRRELKKSTQRDVIDFIEFDINPDVWINRLVRDISSGRYEPQPPARFSLGKSNGFSRRMTMPAIPDLVLYRTIVDHLYRRARRRERKHVYFERAAIENARKLMQTTLHLDLMEHSGPYEALSKKRFRAWLCYDQYRKLLIFKRVYPTIVLTDITNFFDSILFDEIAASLHEIAAPRRMIGLLFFLLERMSIRGSFAESPRIGIPVDEFDCSRKLAHVVLFPHDDRMVDLVGEDAYVRWMDDQNLGATSKAHGLRILSEIGESLRGLHLTPNAAKSRLLSIAEARRHFHLDVNRDLDRLEVRVRVEGVRPRWVAAQVRSIWRKAAKHEGKGEWEKILKRLYRLMGNAGSRFLRRRAAQDVLRSPGLATRVSDYVRTTGTAREYVRFAKTLWGHDEQIYESVGYALVEGLLRLDPDVALRRELRTIGSDLLTRRLRFTGSEACLQIAPLLLLRYGDRRSLPLLERTIEQDAIMTPPGTTRAAAIVLASYGERYAVAVKRLAGRLLRGSLAVTVRMIDEIEGYQTVPERLRQRVRIAFDSVARSQHLDMRGVLVARLLGLNRRREVRAWLAHEREKVASANLSRFEATLLAKLWPKERSK